MTKIDCPQTLDDQLIDIVPLAGIDDLVYLEIPSIAKQSDMSKFDSLVDFWRWLRGMTSDGTV